MEDCLLGVLQSRFSIGIALLAASVALWLVAPLVYHAIWDSLKLLSLVVYMCIRGGSIACGLIGAWQVLQGVVECFPDQE
jgi:hypothetical protein